jgi:hypothetical protein
VKKLKDLFDKLERDLTVGCISNRVAISLELYNPDEPLETVDRNHFNNALDLLEAMIIGCHIKQKGEELPYKMKKNGHYVRIVIDRALIAFPDHNLNHMDLLLDAISIALINILSPRRKQRRPTDKQLDRAKDFFKSLTESSITNLKVQLAKGGHL